MEYLQTTVSGDGLISYDLVRFSDKYVIYKSQKNQLSPQDAGFSEVVAEFSDEAKAREFFNKMRI